jgi:hypothetical protein
MALTNKEIKALEAGKAQAKALWIRACIVDGIEPTGQFIVFSDDNPAARDYNAAVLDLMKLRNRIKANAARRERHAAYKDLGLNRVKGGLGGTYYE